VTALDQQNPSGVVKDHCADAHKGMGRELPVGHTIPFRPENSEAEKTMALENRRQAGDAYSTSSVSL
jgi:hypothetical protein